MAINKVEICGVNTAKLPILSSEQKGVLFDKILSGDNAAREEYIKGNLRLVLSVIQRFNNRGEHVDDLFQVGCIGLIKAIDNFDVTQNVKFSTYAVPMIIGEIRRYLRDNNAIRVSRSLRDTAYKALQTKEQLTRKNAKEPSIQDIANELGIKKEDIVFALDAIQDPISLFEPVYHDESDTLYIMDQVSDEKSQDDIWLENIALKEAMKRINEREKQILMLRFFAGKTQMEVANEIGISQAQVSRLEKTALNHMKKYIFNRDEFTWAEEFYEIIKKKMGLPDYFGCNADALWDMLTGYIDTPCEIVLVGFGKEENVYNRNFLQRIISCFEDAAKEYPEQFKLTKIA